MSFRKELLSKSNKKISIIIFESSKNPKLTIISSHGGLNKVGGDFAETTAKESAQLIEHCLSNNINYIAINFSNNGSQKDQSLNEVLFSDRILDLETAIDFVQEEYKCPIILSGSSLGGHIVINASDYSSQIKGIILSCPAIKAFEVIKDTMDKNEFENWKIKDEAEVFGTKLKHSFYEDLLSHNAMSKIPKLTIPVLIYHGTVDNIVPINQSREAKTLNSHIELIEVDGGSHRFGKMLQAGEWEEKVEQFINKILLS
jgi:alpha-beta hydrolase superfamily lysophospholipase